MVKTINDLQQIGNEQVDLALKSFDALSKGAQAIALEVADYSKESFEQGSTAVEKLFAARSFDKAVEIQGEYVRTAYEGFVARAAKVGELYAALAQESYRPFERYVGKAVR